MVEVQRNIMKKKLYISKYGTIIEDIKKDDISIFLYPLFLVRRLMYAICLIALYYYPYVQVIVIIIFILFPVLVYIKIDAILSYKCSF